MYCRECGSKISDKAEVCTSCGVRPFNSTNYCQSCGTSTSPNQELCTKCGSKLRSGHSSSQDQPSGWVNFAACCFPIIGLILFFVWKDEKPRSAKAVCKWAVIGFVAGIVLYLFFLFLGAMTESMMYY